MTKLRPAQILPPAKKLTAEVVRSIRARLNAITPEQRAKWDAAFGESEEQLELYPKAQFRP